MTKRSAGAGGSNAPPRRRQWPALMLAAVLTGAGAGCQREEIQVYTVPKEKPTRPAGVTEPVLPKARPQVSWTLPMEWKETGPGQMSVASFAVNGSGGAEAQVTITPLTRLAGRDTEIVNMWREQVGLEPLSREDVARQFQTVEVGGEPGKLFEIAGTPEGGSGSTRIVTAMVHRSDASWFYKLAGDAALVKAQKPVFIQFLKSIRLKESVAAGDDSTPPAPKPNWSVPGRWKELAAGQMQVARFAVPEHRGAKAEVFVSVFDSDTGGTLANVNRWRRQIGLAEVQPGDLASLVSPLDPKNPDAILIDMTNSNKRLLGAIVPRRGSFWFYKLLGDAEAVSAERDALVAFAKSQP